MDEEAVIIDTFEYKGRKISVYKDSEGKYYFKYSWLGEEITLGIEEIKHFLKSSFSHTTINQVPVDIIEKSVKFNDLIYDYKDLLKRIKKYN